MNEQIISRLCVEYFAETPQCIKRFAVGHGNFVYLVEFLQKKYVVRCSAESNAYDNMVYWLERLGGIGIPVPKVIARGKFQEYEYLILTYIEGEDLGLVYSQMTDCDKKAVAKEIVQIQNQVAALQLEHVGSDWSWHTVVDEMLERAGDRIVKNGYFDAEKVERLRGQKGVLEEYFSSVKPIAYLDDVSTKNLLICHGRISGIIDIDWIGVGDKLTFAALTNMALLNDGADTDYVTYILEEMQLSGIERKAFLFYTLLFCVDFMGERGMQFMDKRVEVNDEVIGRLNAIYDRLWTEWERWYGSKCQ